MKWWEEQLVDEEEFEDKPVVKPCSTCRYLDNMYGVVGCLNPLAATEDRVRGTVFPVISAPWMMTRDPHGVLEKCDAGNWHTQKKKKSWWSL